VTYPDGTSISYFYDVNGNRTSVVTALPAPPSGTFSASPAAITTGGSSTLTWNIQNTTGVSISGIGSVAASGSTPVSPSATTTYTLTANGYGGPITLQAPVSVYPLPSITQFSANPGSINSGGTSVLTWGITGAQTASINQGIGNVSASGGTRNVSPTTSTTYILTATNPAGGQTTAPPVSVVVNSAPTCSLTANFIAIGKGDTVRLSWTSAGASSVSLSGIGTVTPVGSGFIDLQPQATTLYALTATGAGGPPDVKSVEVKVCEATLLATPNPVPQGQPTTLSWNNQNAQSASISGIGPVSPPGIGSIQVSPGSTTNYTMTVTGIGGGTHSSRQFDDDQLEQH
jgi:hypothetical protein